jgi:regulatory protein
VFDVKMKIKDWNLRPEVVDEIIRKLFDENYLDEERYARNFAGGKFRIKKWGRNKILIELSKKRIPEIYIQMALQEIDEGEYLDALKELITKKEALLNVKDPVKKKTKLISYASSKGYGLPIILKVLEGMSV